MLATMRRCLMAALAGIQVPLFVVWGQARARGLDTQLGIEPVLAIVLSFAVTAIALVRRPRGRWSAWYLALPLGIVGAGLLRVAGDAETLALVPFVGAGVAVGIALCSAVPWRGETAQS